MFEFKDRNFPLFNLTVIIFQYERKYIRDRCFSLKPNLLEPRSLLDNWSKAGVRTQHIQSGEEDQDETNKIFGTTEEKMSDWTTSLLKINM